MLPTETSVRNLNESGFILEALGKPTLVRGCVTLLVIFSISKGLFNVVILLPSTEEFWQAIFFYISMEFFLWPDDSLRSFAAVLLRIKERKDSLRLFLPPKMKAFKTRAFCFL